MKNANIPIQEQLIHEMRTQDIHTIKVKQITDALNISRSTFYLYYNSVFEVLDVIEDTLITNIENISKLFWSYPPNEHYLRTAHPVILKTLEYVKENKEYSKVLWGPYGDPGFKIKCRRLIRNAFFPPHLIETSPGNDSLYEIAFLTGGHLELVNCWIQMDCQYDIEKLTLLVYRLMYSDYK